MTTQKEKSGNNPVIMILLVILITIILTSCSVTPQDENSSEVGITINTAVDSRVERVGYSDGIIIFIIDGHEYVAFSAGGITPSKSCKLCKKENEEWQKKFVPQLDEE